MKRIDTQGIYSIEPMDGNSEWYWGSDYTHRDLYDAEELFKDNNHPVKCNRLVFVHYPDGKIIEPIKGKEGQYFGKPIFFAGNIHILLVDFPKSLIQIFQYNEAVNQTILFATIPLGEVEDCYNLFLHHSPIMLTRQGNDEKFQIIWPEKVEFGIGKRESFCDRDGDKMYFSRWLEEPDYREEVVVRKYPTGEILEIIPGGLMVMPDGQRWLLR